MSKHKVKGHALWLTVLHTAKEDATLRNIFLITLNIGAYMRSGSFLVT